MTIENIDQLVEVLTDADYDWMCRVLTHDGMVDKRLHEPDVTLAPDGRPYLFRWYLTPNDPERGVNMLHAQVLSDPERPLHDHPWDNQSVIVSGGYDEILQSDPPHGQIVTEFRRKGHVITRAAREAHRLQMPVGVPYTLTLFSAGPKIKDWGFWNCGVWDHNKQWVINRADGVSVNRRNFNGNQ
jgi:hypothetical protein